MKLNEVPTEELITEIRKRNFIAIPNEAWSRFQTSPKPLNHYVVKTSTFSIHT